MSTKIARVYCRISKEDKEKPDTTIKNQKSIGMNAILNNGWELDTKKPFYIAIDEKSWKPLNERKVLNEAYSDCSDYDILVVKDWFRFARGRTREDLEFQFRQKGIEIYPVQDSTDEVSKDANTFIGSMIIKKARRDALNMQRNKIEIGLPISKPPIGYKYNNKKEYIINHTKKNIIEQVYNNKIKKIDYKITCKELNISKKQYYSILKNPIYIGYISFERKLRDPDGKIISKTNIIYKGIHEPIINEETWLKVNKTIPTINLEGEI